MKKFRYYFIVILGALAIVATFSFQSCHPGNNASKSERVTALLKRSSWKLQNAFVDGVNKNDLYEDMTIVFSESTFTTTNGGVLLPANGDWHFLDKTATSLDMENGVDMRINEINATSLKLEFEWEKTTFGSGRPQSVSGTHILEFSH